MRNQIQAQKLYRYEMVVGLGGKEYRAVLEQAFGTSDVEICFPFAGLRSGKAMEAIKRAIELDELCPQLGNGR